MARDIADALRNSRFLTGEECAAAADEIDRLRVALGRSAFILSRAADACADGDLSDPRIDDLSAYAAEIEGMYQKSRSEG